MPGQQPPLSPDGQWFWDGQQWRPVGAPVPPAATQKQAARRFLVVFLAILLLGIITGLTFVALMIPARNKARAEQWDVGVQKDLRNAAFLQESYFLNNEHYTQNISDLEAIGLNFAPGDNYAAGRPLLVAEVDEQSLSFCIEATSRSGRTFSLDSANRLQEKPCD